MLSIDAHVPSHSLKFRDLNSSAIVIAVIAIPLYCNILDVPLSSMYGVFAIAKGQAY